MKKSLPVKLPDGINYRGGGDGRATTIVGDRIWFIEAFHDEDCPSPLDGDAMGTIHTFKHHNHRDGSDAHKHYLIGMEADPDAIALKYLDYGSNGCAWRITESVNSADGVWVPDKYFLENIPAEPQFQLVRTARIYCHHCETVWAEQDAVTVRMTGKCTTCAANHLWEHHNEIEEFETMAATPQRRAWLLEHVKSIVEEYSQWCNGDCYGFSVKIYKTRKHSGGDVYNDIDDYRFDEALFDESCHGFVGHEYMEQELFSTVQHILSHEVKLVA